jgi:DNA-binding IclR family transcriptional regulator
MSRNSPSVDRAITILNFFGAHPKQAFSLVDIVKSLKISAATAHAILESLTKGQYLYRFPDKTYMLGPALASIGRGAMEAFTPLLAARVEARSLADKYDIICSVLVRRGENAVVLERAASRSHLDWDLNREVPTADPQFGRAFLSWASPAEIAAWIESATPPLDPERRRILEDSAGFFQKHGYRIDCRDVSGLDRERARSVWNSRDIASFTLTDIDRTQEYSAASITAPAFDLNGNVILVLAMAGFTHALSGERLMEIGEDLRQRCDHVGGLIASMGSLSMDAAAP